MKVYLNGEILDEGQAQVSVHDWGLMYGYGVFDTMRAYNGKIFSESKHIDRVLKSASVAGINISLSKDEISNAFKTVLAENKLKDACLKIVVTYGVAPSGMRFEGESTPTIIIIPSEIPDFTSVYENGIKVVVAENRRNNHSKLSGVKSLNYMENALARLSAQKVGFDDAIFLNCDDLVAEATTANIFVYKDSTLITPPPDAGILAGITRGIVLGIAAELGVLVKQEDFTLDAFVNSDECFLTSSVAEITPAIEVEAKMIGDGKPGQITKKIHKQYHTLTKPQI